MFEKELERARKILRGQLAATTPYIPLQSILSNGAIHPTYRTYAGAEVAWWVYEERAIRHSNPRFDTTEPAFRELFAKIDAEYVKAARFDHEELTAVIDAATKTRLNLLCRPRTTLKWFVYRGEPTRPLHEVLLRLNYLHDYPYLTDGIRSWAAAKGADGSPSFEILSIIEFERVVEKVDNDAILDLTQREFVQLLDPMFEFFAEHNPDLPPEVIPTEAVIIFLDDKGAIPISQALERLLYREEHKLLSRSKLIEVIDGVIQEIELSSTAAASTYSRASMPVEPMESMAHPEQEPERAASPPTVETESRIEPLHQPAQSEQPEEPTDTQPLTSPLTATAVSTHDRRIEAFHRNVEASLQKRFLERLFSSDLGKMDTMVSHILEVASWREAAVRLDLWYAQHGVDPNGTVAMELAHALNQVYR